MQAYRIEASRWRHPVNVAFHQDASVGVRVANGMTGFMGSWLKRIEALLEQLTSARP